MKNIEKDKLPEDIADDLKKIENNNLDKELENVTNIKNDNETIDQILNNDIQVEEDENNESDEENDLIIKLKKPIKGITEIELDPDKITGFSLTKIEKLWRSKNKSNRETIKELDGDYLAMVAATMSGIVYSDIMELGGFDFTQTISKVRNFLLVG